MKQTIALFLVSSLSSVWIFSEKPQNKPEEYNYVLPEVITTEQLIHNSELYPKVEKISGEIDLFNKEVTHLIVQDSVSKIN